MGESYEQLIREIHGCFQNYIFVYGTLMTGQPNHDAFLGENDKIADGWIEGYEMYDLGNYPGIKEGEGQVFGEVYALTDEELARIDQLEGDGYLYYRAPVKVHTVEGQTLQALVYVYKHSVEGCTRLSGRYGR